MGKINAKGFKLGRKLLRVMGSLLHRNRRPRLACRRLGSSSGIFWKICTLGRWITHQARRICKRCRKSGYIRLVKEPGQDSDPFTESVPKGYLAVYVGEKDDERSRVLVPVIYFNHPLFAGLLTTAEKVYGFEYAGGIQIPCRKSEFEDVRKKIAAANSGGCLQERWRGRLLIAC